MERCKNPKGGRMHKDNVRRLSHYLRGSDWVQRKDEQPDWPDEVATNFDVLASLDSFYPVKNIP